MAIYRGPGGSGDATTDATNEATVASNAAAAASASQTAAANSATSAATDATNAANSATAAASSASSAATSASTATTQASNASTSASNASTSASNAATSETNATASATLANDWATKTSGTVAGGEYSAKYHAQAASTSASNASTSASNAATSETNAAASAASAASLYDSFDDRYLGAKSSDPTLDNDGNALLTGALYFNTVANKLKEYTGSAWVTQAASGANSDITSLSGLTTALSIAQGGTGQTTASGAINALLPSQTSNSGKVLSTNGSAASWITVSGTGTVTSVDVSAGTTGLSFTGGPVTASGTITLSGTLDVDNGGTGATTAAGARTNLLPSFTGNAGKVLAVNTGATDVEYITVAGTGTVTSVAATVPTGLSISGSPITTAGTLAITYASGYSIPTTTSQSNWDTAYGWGNHASAGYALNSNIGVTIQGYDADLSAIAALSGTSGLLKKTAANTWTLDTTAYTTNTGTVTSVDMSVPTGLTITGNPITTSGTLALSLTSGYSIPTTSSQTNWDTAYSERQQWDGGSTNLVASTGRTSLGVTATGSDTTYAYRANNLSDLASASTARTNLGLGTIATLAAPSGTVVGTSDTQTLTNKWIQPRVLASTANSATPTLNTDSYDMMVITGQSVAITSFTTNLTGTPVNGQKLWIAITGTGAIAITWGASFEASTTALPTTTVTTNRLDVGFVWNAATSKWRCVAVA